MCGGQTEKRDPNKIMCGGQTERRDPKKSCVKAKLRGETLKNHVWRPN